MKKTQWIELWQTIRRTKVSYIAIILFIMASVLFYFGLGWTSGMINRTVDRNFKSENTRDLEVFCSSHLTDEDLEVIRSLPEVSEAEGLLSTYYNFTYDSTYCLASIREITDSIDRLTVSEGRLPESSDELAVDAGWAERNNFQVGSVITFEENESMTTAMLDGLKNETFTITGFVSNPAYSCISSGTYGTDLITGKNIDAVFYGTREIFSDPDAGYRSVLLTGTGLKGYSFDSDEYISRCSDLEDSVLAAVTELDRDNYNELSDGYAAMGIQLPEYPGCVTQTKTSLKVLVSINLLTDMMSRLNISLSLIFIVVGFLVCYIAITRLIHSERCNIGMKKSFGMTAGQILSGYILYTLSASFLGFGIGIPAGYLVEWILCTRAVTSIYCLPEYSLYIDGPMIVIAFLCVMLIVSGITVFAVYSTVKADALELMKDAVITDGHKHFYEKFKVWNRLPLLVRMIINNCVTERRRVFGTLISIAGCMALFVGAITFYYNVNYSIDTQFQKYFHFHLILETDENDPDALDELTQNLEENGAEVLPIHFELAYLETREGDYGNARFFVLPDDPDTEKFIELETYGTDSSADLYGGIYAGQAYSSYYGDDAGDSLEVINLIGKRYTVPVDGYFKTYLLELPIVLSEDAYTDLFGEEPVPNALLVLSDGHSDDEIISVAGESDGLQSVYNYYEGALDVCSTFRIVVTVISAIYIIVAVIMSFLVLLNILAQFVREKKNEIIIMQINGYPEKAARKYILTDNIFLTVIGIIPGAVIGSLIGFYSISSLDSPFVAWMKTPVLPAFIIGFCATALLSSIMCLISMLQIHSFDISDITK